jgi:hypothetical protein
MNLQVKILLISGLKIKRFSYQNSSGSETDVAETKTDGTLWVEPRTGFGSNPRSRSIFHFKEDPDPTFNFGADPDPSPYQCDANLNHFSTDPPGLHIELPRLHCERPRPPRLHFERYFDLNADPDPAFHSIYWRSGIRIQLPQKNADPDP